ncbi:MAG TPA: M23 family metallopeptidase [Pyrinomonadaceae bacterium]|jgi:murein DD-endopeptidase MepM/ murein hydrolase activator NlpD
MLNTLLRIRRTVLVACLISALVSAAGATPGRGPSAARKAGAAAPGLVRVPTLEPTGMAKPVANLRDYNGTLFGASGTGGVGYTTLYRDNEDYGAASGCNGEGCGRHPGVDIPVGSGTAVFASLGGTVVRSECNGGVGTGWGGLIVIRSTNPWNANETLYFTYAHLKARYYAVGQWVNTGTQIGLSGGNRDLDTCPGNSTNSHLHFQIDKDDGNDSPYFPATTTELNQRDTDFRVTAKTYNPVVFVTGGYRWSFNKAGDRELWEIVNLQNWGVSNDALWVNGIGDTYIRRGGDVNCGQARPCSSSIAAEAGMYPKVYLDLYNVCFSNPGKIYFTTSTSPGWDETKSVAYYPSGQGPYQQHIYMTQNSEWKGIITGLRIDPGVNCSSGDDPTYYGEITIER